MNIHISREDPTPIYLQIKNQLRTLIYQGHLEVGFRLPSERKLAEHLGINRSTVVNAYAELRAEGLVECFVGKGTIVQPFSCEPESVEEEQNHKHSMPWNQVFSERTDTIRDPLIRNLMAFSRHTDEVSFAIGISDPGTEFAYQLAEQFDKLLKGNSQTALIHCPTEGIVSLREQICDWMSVRGVRSTPDEVIVLSGSQQGLDLIARVFIDPGDCILVEDPTYFGALQTFRASGAKIIGIPSGADGQIRTDVLETLMARHHPKLIYLLPTFQNPTGRVMDLPTRKAVLDIAYRYKAAIVEEDPYFDLRYEGTSIPPIKAMDRCDHVIYLNTFSKMLAPGLRTGWLVAPRQVIRRLTLAKQLSDLHPGSLSQMLIEGAIRSGLLRKHLEYLRKSYMARRDSLDEVLRLHAIPGLQWTVPEGGIFMWCRLPDGINESVLHVRAADMGVKFLTGSAFFATEPMGKYARLNFAAAATDRVREGAERFIQAINMTLNGP